MATPDVKQLLFRRRDAAVALGVSASQILRFERAGAITAIRVPGTRAVRYTGDEVRSLAARIVAGDLARPAVAGER